MQTQEKGKIRIVLAEDHVVVREGIRHLIDTEDDMEVLGEAGDGMEAVQMVKDKQPDIVLMDVAMPGLNGIEATRQIKESFPAVAVLVLTAYDSDEFVFAAVEAGAAGYLLKNIRGRELLNSIRATHDGESVLHPIVAEKLINHLRLEKGRPPRQDKGETLTQREMEVVKLSMEGRENKEIAEALSLGLRTVQTHWRNIFNKLGVSSRTEAIVHVIKNGWVVVEQNKA